MELFLKLVGSAILIFAILAGFALIATSGRKGK